MKLSNRRNQRDDRGQGMVEWAGILLLVSIMCMLALVATGTNIRELLEGINSKFSATEALLDAVEEEEEDDADAGGVGASGGGGESGASCRLARGQSQDSPVADLLLLTLPLMAVSLRRRRELELVTVENRR